MEKLITISEAQKLVSGSDERKSELIKLMNAAIISQAERGLTWAHLPLGINVAEEDFLKDKLTLNGFKVSNDNPAVTF